MASDTAIPHFPTDHIIMTVWLMYNDDPLINYIILLETKTLL